jgi:hypothetical protein
MSTPYKQQKTADTTIPFSKIFAKVMYVNSKHASSHDWKLLDDCDLLHLITDKQDTHFLSVPDDDYHFHQNLIDRGFSFAFVSLLQVAVRNSASWIHFSPFNEVVSGIHVFSHEETVQ